MVFVHNVVCELVILDDIKVLLCSEVMQQKRKNAEKEFNMMEKREGEEGVHSNDTISYLQNKSL